MTQLNLFAVPEEKPSLALIKNARSGSFTDNMQLPVHRWFRYSAGFSAEWAEAAIRDYGASLVYDPFAGSGTTLLAAQAQDIDSIGSESHPFVYRIARAKLHRAADIAGIRTAATMVRKIASQQLDNVTISDAPLLQKCYTPDNLIRLEALKQAYQTHSIAEDPIWETVWLAITAILRACSTAGTAQWQYILPNKQKSSALDAFCAFDAKIGQLIDDIQQVRYQHWEEKADLRLADAREAQMDYEQAVDLVLTSPPYPNNYDYADATRLEMTFWGEISGWGELQKKVRRYLVRSCSQHSAAEKLDLEILLKQPELAPIHSKLTEACYALAEIRLTKGGKKTYHTMAAAYFLDLAKVFHALRRMCKPGAKVCFVVGDSAPYGVYLAVDEWLGQLAVAAGFKSFSFEKLRDRNIKWKNRKHTVPLHEGRLWIEG